MITIKHNISKVSKQTKAKGKKMSKMEVAHKKISIMLGAWVDRNFKTSGGKVGGWKPFQTYCVGGDGSPYGLSKTCGVGRIIGKKGSRRIDTSANMLRDSDKLNLSFDDFFDQHEAGVRSIKPYAKPHNDGLGHLPKRRLIPEEKDVKKEVRRIYEHHIKDALK